MVRREKLGRKDTYMYQTRKIGVVGQGHVGAHVANSLLMQGIADELYLCDINEAKVTSEVQDLRDSLSFVPYNTKIVNCYDHYEELACCDVIVNAAGKVALAAGNRDGELFFTTDAARTFAKRIVDAGFDGIFVSISNPCDVVCTELWHLTGYDPKKIIGSGCGLDSARLRTEISKKVGVSPKSIDAYMIGEHGFSQLAAFKAATIAGKSLNELQAENPDKYAFDHMEIEELARKGGYVTYQGKQCTEYAVANSAARVCAAVLHNEHAVLSASTLMTGQYGEEGIFTSLPCVIGARGRRGGLHARPVRVRARGLPQELPAHPRQHRPARLVGRRGLRRKVGRRLPQPCESKRDTKRAAPEIPGAARFFDSRNALANRR